MKRRENRSAFRAGKPFFRRTKIAVACFILLQQRIAKDMINLATMRHYENE